jgi:hypothetical protein
MILRFEKSARECTDSSVSCCKETAAGYIAESLRKVAFLKTLDDESLGLLGYLFRQKICSSGEVVCAEGEKGSSFFILVQGRALVSTTGT